MGAKLGYYYKCKKCGTRLDDTNFLLYRLNPIKFDYLIKECPICNSKYIAHYQEFFTVTKKDFYKLLVVSLCTWVIFLNIILLLIISEFCSNEGQTQLLTNIIIILNILFGVFYCILFKKRWGKAIKESIKRLNNEEYIFNLLLYNILDLESITYCYNNKIISKKTYDDVLYNINQFSENIKENNEEIEADKLNLLIKKFEKEK